MDYKILLADDSVTRQKVVTLTFKDEGVEVVTADNGDEAINRLQYLRPDLVMADVSIPGKNGYEICEFIKKHPDLKHTPVVLLVPAFEPFDEERAHSVGVDRYLTRPFQSIPTLISTVMSLIEPEKYRGTGSGVTGPLGWENRPSSAAEGAVIVEVMEILDSRSGSRSGHLDSGPLSLASAEMPDEFEAVAAPILPEKISEVISMDPAQTATSEELHELARTEKSDAPQLEVEEDLDSVLELDDVLFWGAPALRNVTIGVVEGHRVIPASQTESISEEAPTGSVSQSFPSALPQSSIDEIVNRVVAQVTERLPEILSRELVHRMAPELIEIVKGQLVGEKKVYREADSLLELDEM